MLWSKEVVMSQYNNLSLSVPVSVRLSHTHPEASTPYERIKKTYIYIYLRSVVLPSLLQPLYNANAGVKNSCKVLRFKGKIHLDYLRATLEKYQKENSS